MIITGISQSQAQTSGFKTFSLKQAVEYAIQNNVKAKNDKLSEAEAKARNQEILSIGQPQISANFDYSYYIARPYSAAIAQIFNDPNSLSNQIYNYQIHQEAVNNQHGLDNIINKYSAAHKNDKIYFVLPNNVNTGVQLNQMVFDGRFFVGLKATKDLLKVAQLTSQLSQQDIKYNVMKSYYDCQSAKEIISTLDSNLAIIQKMLHDTRETYKSGLIEELDVNRLELAEGNLQSQINNVKNLYTLSLSSLKYNMGMSIAEKIALTDNIEVLRKAMSQDALGSFDPKQRIEEQLLETSVLLKGFDMDQRKTGYYPNLYAFINYGGGSQVDKVGEFFKASNWFQQSTVGFSLKIPIWDGGQKMASVKQAKLQLQKAQNDLDDFKNAASLQVEAAKTTLGTNLIEESNATQSKALSQKIFNKTKTKFDSGIGSSFELFQSQQDLTSGQIRYINALKSVLAARADLDKPRHLE